MTAAFVEAFSEGLDLKAVEVGGLWAVLDIETHRACLLGHPLWRSDPGFYVEAQVTADDELRRAHGAKAVKAFDLYTLGRRPHDLFGWLAATEQ
jgi:hypothetical protein